MFELAEEQDLNWKQEEKDEQKQLCLQKSVAKVEQEKPNLPLCWSFWLTVYSPLDSLYLLFFLLFLAQTLPSFQKGLSAVGLEAGILVGCLTWQLEMMPELLLPLLLPLLFLFSLPLSWSFHDLWLLH